VKGRTREERAIVAAAERRMRGWSLAQEIAEAAVGKGGTGEPDDGLGHYITISRQAGAGGSRIAEMVGEKLGWDVLDKNLVDSVAKQFHLSREALKLVDETTWNWAYDLLGPWLDRQVISHEKYVVSIKKMILAAARRGNMVLVGRGAQFLLPRGHGLSVRIIASEQYRVRQTMEEYSLKEPEAKQLVAAADRGRKDFVARFFHQDVADSQLYDLLIKVDSFGPQATADQIVAAWRHHQTARRQATPHPAAVAVAQG
jgi:cytidylate kinase